MTVLSISSPADFGRMHKFCIAVGLAVLCALLVFSPATYNVYVTALNGFNGTVLLTSRQTGCTGTKCASTLSLNPTSISGSGTSILTVPVPNGPQTLTISVTAPPATLTHQATVTLKVCDQGCCG